ncbi:Cytochrome b-c1 complex subunit 7 [Neolecta irregularis DAH-3]|uniref:Complex III subunit 7 n=1 Tax=Neolecta irregularis (strain DAH-3) TaxID=1198029 RepID=A0A1U7LP71_NEOID|nr:Cytochrome b-c1 complex subunit 7 [Neolecta irregularis DAH-3]|eukprot:OLL24321.1 Cytochrome b-c1 complex subunit 7 [Neolecta irregularis DAH-3]
MSILGYSLYPSLKKSFPRLVAMLRPAAERFVQLSGYRQMGLKYDDLLMEEHSIAQKALGRLSERETYDRFYRLKRGHQLACVHQILPRNEWTKPEDDIRYLTPIIKELEAEAQEKADFDSVKVTKVKSIKSPASL